MTTFPIAAYSYFKIKDVASEKALFLAGKKTNPTFDYTSTATIAELKTRLDATDSLLSRQNLELVIRANQFRAKPTLDNLNAYRNANQALYEAPSFDEANFIMSLGNKLQSENASKEWSYITEKLNLASPATTSFMPDEALFSSLKEYLERYIVTHEIFGETLPDLLAQALQATGLTNRGWKLKVENNAHHARTLHNKKCIVVGRKYSPRSPSAVQQIIFHEVYGHALRGVRGNEYESEGFATLLEQLTRGRFTTVRSYRYVAAAIGWGVFGKPSTFREVYEVVWRLMVLRGRYDQKNAKNHAFDECVRVFRGGLPDKAGAIFLKDTVYLAGNTLVWRALMENPPTYSEFVAMLEGRRSIL